MLHLSGGGGFRLAWFSTEVVVLRSSAQLVARFQRAQSVSNDRESAINPAAAGKTRAGKPLAHVAQPTTSV